jgi:hypothetical protein
VEHSRILGELHKNHRLPLRGTTLYEKGAVSSSHPSDVSDGSDISDPSAKDEQAIFKGGIKAWTEVPIASGRGEWSTTTRTKRSRRMAPPAS